MSSNNTQAVRSAVQLYNGYNITARNAAHRHRVPESTLGHRLRGRPERGINGRHVLDQFEEQCLYNLIKDLQKQGQLATHATVRYYAGILLQSRGQSPILSKNWITRF